MKKTDSDYQELLTAEEMEASLLSGDPFGARTAEVATRFMFAMEYYHKKMKLHIMLHPLYFVAGFLLAYATL
jgi:hypothetical protein